MRKPATEKCKKLGDDLQTRERLIYTPASGPLVVENPGELLHGKCSCASESDCLTKFRVTLFASGWWESLESVLGLQLEPELELELEQTGVIVTRP